MKHTLLFILLFFSTSFAADIDAGKLDKNNNEIIGQTAIGLGAMTVVTAGAEIVARSTDLENRVKSLDTESDLLTQASRRLEYLQSHDPQSMLGSSNLAKELPPEIQQETGIFGEKVARVEANVISDPQTVKKLKELEMAMDQLPKDSPERLVLAKQRNEVLAQARKNQLIQTREIPKFYENAFAKLSNTATNSQRHQAIHEAVQDFKKQSGVYIESIQRHVDPAVAERIHWNALQSAKANVNRFRNSSRTAQEALRASPHTGRVLPTSIVGGIMAIGVGFGLQFMTDTKLEANTNPSVESYVLRDNVGNQ